MKKLIYIFLAVVFLGCEDEPIKIVYGPPNITGDQKILVEEFTGVKCTFCPQGSRLLESLSELYPEKVILVSVHSGFFAKPVAGKSKLDFQTSDGDDIYNYIGPVNSYPAASFNRIDYAPNGYLSGSDSWSNNIQNIANQTAKASLNIETLFNPFTRLLTVKLKGIAKVDINENILANVYITESGIVDYQLDNFAPGGHVDDYIHKHVFRDALTNIPGEVIASNPRAGDTFSKEYTYTVPDTWVAENCKVIGYLAYTSKKEIIQVEETNLVE